jgi:hypothetical protein
VAYVLHARNMHRTEGETTLREFRRLAAKHRGDGQKVGGSSFFRWVAASHRRSGRRFRAALVYLEAAIRYRQVGDLARAVGMLLGERIIALGRRSAPPIIAAEPPWLRSHTD